MGGGFPLRLKRRTESLAVESDFLASAARGQSGAGAHGLGWVLDLAGPPFGVTGRGSGCPGPPSRLRGATSGAMQRAFEVAGRAFEAVGRALDVTVRVFEVTGPGFEVAARVFGVAARHPVFAVTVRDAEAWVSCSNARSCARLGRKERCQGAASQPRWSRIRFRCARSQLHGEPTCPLPRTGASHCKRSERLQRDIGPAR